MFKLLHECSREAFKIIFNKYLYDLNIYTFFNKKLKCYVSSLSYVWNNEHLHCAIYGIVIRILKSIPSDSKVSKIGNWMNMYVILN